MTTEDFRQRLVQVNSDLALAAEQLVHLREGLPASAASLEQAAALFSSLRQSGALVTRDSAAANLLRTISEKVSRLNTLWDSAAQIFLGYAVAGSSVFAGYERDGTPSGSSARASCFLEA